MRSKREEKVERVSRLILKNTIIIFLCLLICFIFSFVFIILFFELGIISPHTNNSLTIILALFLLSLILGSVVSVVGARKISKPILELEKATEEIAKGNFDYVVKEEESSELSGLIHNFNLMTKELKTHETLKNDFISNVSHEFKTPLAVIQSYSKSLRKPGLDEKTKVRYQEVIDKNIKKLTNLTTNILSLSKIENQEIVPNRKDYLIDEQIRQNIVELEPEWAKKKIKFELNLVQTSYYGSEELISQVWQNLISNAIKFCPDKGGKISIKVEGSYGLIKVSVADNGIGMSEEVLGKIYDKFYQADTSRSKEGNGLGLALVKRILKICDGTIAVTSKENEGTTFVVTLKNIVHNKK